MDSKFNSDQLLKLLELPYEMTDSGDELHVSMKIHLTDDLEMHPLTRDVAYFVNLVHGKLSGMLETYVDELV